MNLDEAVAYIRSHPAAFAGASEEEILSKTQSSNDANYYDPTLYVPEQKATVAKPNTATRGASVSYGPTPAAPKPAPSAGSKTAASSLTNALVAPSKFTLPKITTPVALGIGILILGAGFGIYKAQR